ncbi:hypothetical protein FIBSPDRAFT_960009 [Athelia psychrophila]|uniref:Uncharacterized protein n=1 Tax=Athelia psychrophila TaxID=1759441 RepID=A0A166CWB6_9AGAM|nr:hypothetical protein FIBSPDRAFT_960009 [Fibularhizoctonia sp. CBS 109695]
MPRAPLLASLSLLQGGITPAVSHVIANAAPPFLRASKALTSSSLTSDVCDNLSNCRSLDGLVTSCLITIAACILVAVHPDIPGPTEIPWLLNRFGESSVIGILLSRNFESFKLVVKALLVPEWYLASAVRQVLRARDCASELEEARVKAAVKAAGEAIARNNWDKLVELQKLEFELRTTDRSWTITHAFFTNMGGFHYYSGGIPTTPLAYKDVLELVELRSLDPPTLDELRDKSKGDELSKSIAVFQTLWFIMQCIARRIEKRAITNLEIMTLAYTVITVAMYAAWWDKPLAVRYPIRVLALEKDKDTPVVESGKKKDKVKLTFKWSAIIAYVSHNEDRLVIFLNSKKTFWSGIIGLAIAMVFGAIHFAAWSFAFPTPVERWAWRVCAIAIVAIPLALTVALVVFKVFNPVDPPIPTDPDLPIRTGHRAYTYHIPLICMPLCALLYIPARILLLGLSFSTLRHLPLSAYQTIQWTSFIPHI